MKPDLTPAKPWGFHLTGHLNLPHSAGLEGKRVSKELMEKKARATGRIPVSMSVVWTPTLPPSPHLTQPPQLVPYSTHLTSLHCKSSGVKDFRRKWGNAAPAILFQTLKTLASPKLSLVTALCAASVLCQLLVGCHSRCWKGNQIDASAEKYFYIESLPDSHQWRCDTVSVVAKSYTN